MQGCEYRGCDSCESAKSPCPPSHVWSDSKGIGGSGSGKESVNVNTWMARHASHEPVNFVPGVHKPSRITPCEHPVEIVQYNH